MFEETLAELRAAHDELTAVVRSACSSARGPVPNRHRRRGGHRSPGRASAGAQRAAPARSRRLRGQSQAGEAARAEARDLRRGRNRLGARRGAGVRVAPRGGHSDPPVGPGHRARHVLAPARRPARPENGGDLHAAAASADGVRVLRDLQLAALRVRGARLRARVLDRRSGRARALGGAVRRLRERRPDRGRPVHRLGPLEVGPDVTACVAPPARLRGERARALERSTRALPPAGRPGEHPRRQLHDGGAVLPPSAPAGARCDRAPARPHDAERASEAPRRDVDARGSDRLGLSARARRLRCRPLRRDARSFCAAGRCTTTSWGTSYAQRRAEVAVARLEQLYPFPLDQMAALVASYPEVREIVWAQEEPQNMGAWRSIRHRLEEAASRAAQPTRVRYVGRPWRASTSEGYPTLHHYEQDRIVREALGGGAST